MTEKQASAWVDANCRFAMIESIKDMVKTSAMRSGIKLNDQEADFYAVKAIVCASLVTAALSVEDILRDYYGIDDNAFNAIISNAVSQSDSKESAVEGIIADLGARIQQQSRVNQKQVARPSIILDRNSPAGKGTRAMLHAKVKQYLEQTDPAKLYGDRVEQKGLAVGPHAQDPAERARVKSPPTVTPQGAAPMTQPTPYKPIPRQPGQPGEKLPPGKTRQPSILPGTGKGVPPFVWQPA